MRLEATHVPPQGSTERSTGPAGTAATCGLQTRRWTLTAGIGAVPVLRNAVCAFATAAGIGEPTLGNLRLSLSEAISNEVIHSYRDDPAPGAVSVLATVDAAEVRAVVSDTGMGFVPRLDSPGLGVGLVLIASTATSFAIRDGVPSGTDVHMAFAR